jgi:hypothetical protein
MVVMVINTLRKVQEYYNNLAQEYMQERGYDESKKSSITRAIVFYKRENHISKKYLFSQLDGIDFSYEIQVASLPTGTILDQMQEGSYAAGEIRQGQYYAFHCANKHEHADARGIADCTLVTDNEFPGHQKDNIFAYALSKQLTRFYVTKSIKVLISVAKPVHDSWSMRLGNETISAKTNGGGTQIYITQEDNAYVKPEHQLAYEELMQELSKGLSVINFSVNERETLIKQIFILKNKASFAKNKGLNILSFKLMNELKEIKETLQQNFPLDIIANDYAAYGAGVSIRSILLLVEQSEEILENNERNSDERLAA